jgi:hypothetical protein
MTRDRSLRTRITPEAISAWRRGDYLGLHRALKLHPGHPSPLPLSVDPLGVDPNDPPDTDDGARAWSQGWQAAVDLQRELLRLAGPPRDEA